MRLTPLILLALAACVARLFGHDGDRVSVGAWELPHLCPARSADAACFGCGATRASLDLLRGDWAGAWALQPFVFLLPLVFVVEAFAPRLGPARTARLRVLLGVSVALVAILPALLPA